MSDRTSVSSFGLALDLEDAFIRQGAPPFQHDEFYQVVDTLSYYTEGKERTRIFDHLMGLPKDQCLRKVAKISRLAKMLTNIKRTRCYTGSTR